MKHTTYDYKAQKWVTGDEAKKLRRVQLIQELELLKSTNGEPYLLSIGSWQSRGDAINTCRIAIAELNRSLSQ